MTDNYRPKTRIPLLRLIERLLLILILLFALGVRLHGLGFSLPYTTHPDEPNVVDRAVATIKTGDWNPHWFIYPSGYHYLQTIVLTANLLWGIAQGWYSSPADLPDSSHTITSAPETYLWARGTTALFGVLTAFLAYLLGRRLVRSVTDGKQSARWIGPAAGLTGALLVALSPLHVEHSRYVTTDVPTAALTLLAVYLSLEVMERGGGVRAFLAGLVVGIAGGFKYNAVVTLLPLLLAIALRTIRLGPSEVGFLRPLARFFSRALGLALLGVVVGYALACPYTFADLPTFLDDLGYETHIYRFGGEEGIIRTYEVAGRLLPPWLAYAHALWVDNWPSTLAYLGGVILALVRRRKGELVLLSFVGAYYLFLSSYGTIFVRNVLPILPGLAVLGGIFLADGVTWLASRPLFRSGRKPEKERWPLARFSPLLLAALLVVILVWPALRIVRTGTYLATPTSEAQARAWLDDHVDPGGKVAAELHRLLFARARYRVTTLEQGKDFLSNYPLEVFVNLGYTYVVANSEHYGPEFAEQDTLPDYYASLLEQMERVADFPGHTENLPGPRLTIYRVPQGGPRIQHPLEATAGPGLRLLGFDAGRRQGRGDLAYVSGTTALRAGEVLALTLYLQADSGLPEDYLVAVRLRNAEGHPVGWVEQVPCAGACPPTTWTPGTVIVDRADMPLPPVLPAGTYLLEVQFLRPGTKEPLSIAPGGEEGVLPLTEITLLERSP